MHLTLIPYLHSSGELKTKPTQNSVKKLRELGLAPDIIICRTRYDLTKEVKYKHHHKLRARLPDQALCFGLASRELETPPLQTTMFRCCLWGTRNSSFTR